MPNNVKSVLNKPIRAFVGSGEINTGNLRYVATNIQVAYEQKLWFRGIIANLLLDAAADVNPNLTLAIYGFEGVEIDNTRAGILNFFDDSKLTYSYQQNPNLRSVRVAEFFSYTIELKNPGFYSFAAGVSQAGVVFGNGFNIELTVLGELVNKNQKPFPLEYR